MSTVSESLSQLEVLVVDCLVSGVLAFSLSELSSALPPSSRL